ncbi:hypothetical protein [Pedomonas sp. V897]|uniref:hypothetical protein n=1 Tax=Pedomonas sp. V897 TaxID=3446482 RepID=UPI003EE3C658
MMALPWWGKALALAGAVGAVWLLFARLESAAYERGVLAERAEWQKDQQERQLEFRERHDAATEAAAQRDIERERVFVPIEREVIRYVQTPAAATECIDDAGRDLMRRAIEAANSSIAAGASPGGSAVPASAGGPGDGR